MEDWKNSLLTDGGGQYPVNYEELRQDQLDEEEFERTGESPLWAEVREIWRMIEELMNDKSQESEE